MTHDQSSCTYKEGNSSGTSRGSGRALSIDSLIRGHHHGISPIPGPRLNPVYGIVQPCCAPVACIYIVDALKQKDRGRVKVALVATSAQFHCIAANCTGSALQCRMLCISDNSAISQIVYSKRCIISTKLRLRSSSTCGYVRARDVRQYLFPLCTLFMALCPSTFIGATKEGGCMQKKTLPQCRCCLSLQIMPSETS